MFALITEKEKNVEIVLDRLMRRHPLTGYLVLFLCVPVFVLLAVFISTTAIILPIGLVMGWL